MIDALFNEPSYLAMKKTLDAVALRHEAIASNIANLETPGYKRVDVAPSFQSELERACASGDPRQIASLKPALVTDVNAVPQGRDGNTVNLEREFMELTQNTVANAVETRFLSGRLARLKLAITGKS